MNKIEVGLLNYSDDDSIRYRLGIGIAATIAQHGHEIHAVKDLDTAIKMPDDERIARLVSLPHPTLQKFCTIDLLFIGVSRRFLAQITRHQNEIKFMSSSLHFNDHSSEADFVIPIEVLRASHETQLQYEKAMMLAHMHYKNMVGELGSDGAGYLLPNATRCTVFASATLYEWKHIIRQRTCRRCSSEIRYAMLHAWRLLHELDPVIFSPETTGAKCMTGACREGKLSCNQPYSPRLPLTILLEEFGDCMPAEEKTQNEEEA